MSSSNVGPASPFDSSKKKEKIGPDQNEFRKALPKYRKALTILPDFASAYLNYAWALDQLGKNKAAETNYLKSLQLNPNNLKTLRAYSAFLLQNRRHQEAVLLLKEAEKQRLSDPDIFNNLGVGFLMLGERQKAENYFMKALKIDSRHPQARRNLAGLLKNKR